MNTGEARIADAAIEVLADGGMQSLTHQAVDARAGLPEGATADRYRTRDALLGAVLHRILDRETAVWAHLTPAPGEETIDGFADRMGRLVHTLAGPERSVTAARHAIFAKLGASPGLRGELESSLSRVTAWLSPILAELGSLRPEADLNMLLVFIDGLLKAQLDTPATADPPAPAIAALLHGVIDRRF
jgi:AcrR family transcriptional regulator